MKISRANYEIWFTDSADNNLTREQVEELNVFLQLNPDLRLEYEEFMDAMNSDRHSCFRGKDRLKKSTTELPEDQFELLSVAFHENDLTEKQKEEVLEIISADPEKARAFDVIGKIRLSPPSIKYSRKNTLLRKSPATPVVRLAWTALGAAASVAMILLVGSLIHKAPETSVSLAEALKDSIYIIKPEKLIAPAQNFQPQILPDQKNTIAPAHREGAPASSSAGKYVPEQTDIPGKVSYNGSILIAGIEEPRSYLAGSNISYNPVAMDDGRSRISRFIAKTFRDKILNEKAVSDAPLKGYELAEAGIDGLNKLLGWEMAFTTYSDEKGDVNSISFKSKIIKFSAPVKKNESAE